MKILYISSVPSQNQFDFMKSKLKSKINVAKYGMQESGFKFHHLIMDGIASDKSNSVYSLVGRPISSKDYNGVVWHNCEEREGNITYDHIGFINIPIIKNLIISFSYLFKTMKWIKMNEEKEKCIIIDASYITVIPFINLATKFRRCKKVAIVCDIYRYMANVKDARNKKSFIHTLIANKMAKSYKKIDGYVLLTDAMNSIINKKAKPYIVMEGLVDANMKDIDSVKNKINNKLTVMYAGAIREQYGLKNLIYGFHEYKNDNVELLIYGAGDYVTEVEKLSKKDKRIKFMGMISNKDIIKKELEVTLLVNPRPINQEFTKYSFPSKNMEYMVSGTPLLTTKLPGMPSEYYKYIYTINGNRKEDITFAFNEVFKNNKKKLEKKGLESKQFVLDKKNNIIQAKRIISLCGLVVLNENN